MAINNHSAVFINFAADFIQLIYFGFLISYLT